MRGRDKVAQMTELSRLIGDKENDSQLFQFICVGHGIHNKVH